MSAGLKIRDSLSNGLSLTIRIVALFRRAGGAQHAAAIAYFGLIAMLPLAILTTAILAGLVARMPMADDGTDMVDRVFDQFQTALPFLEGEVRNLLVSLTETQISVGFLAGLVLIGGTLPLFNALERGINAIMRTEEHRHILLTKLLLPLLTVSVGTGIFIWQLLKSLIFSWFHEAGITLPWLFQSALWQFSVGLLIPALGFFALISVMCRTHYRKRDRWLGAGLFAVLFKVAHLILTLYLSKVVSYEQLYGAAGAFLGLIIWLFVASTVFLISCAAIRALAPQRLPAQSQSE